VLGVGDPHRLGWVGRLARLLDERGLHLTAYNLGVRSDTSADAPRRWHTEVQARLPTGIDRRVVFSFGVNDTTLLDEHPLFSTARARSRAVLCRI
jgi:acyl-CoA thioesterase-1